MAYTTKEKVEKYLDVSISEDISDWVLAIEKWIENYCGTKFEADETASYRYYDGNGLDELIIDDCISVEEVAIKTSDSGDWIELESSEYKLYPLNETPKQIIRLLSISRYRKFPKGNGNVRVKAKWGYSVACPEDVELATTILVAGIYNASKKSDRAIRSEKIGDYSVVFEDEKGWKDFDWAMRVLNQYKRYDRNI